MSDTTLTTQAETPAQKETQSQPKAEEPKGLTGENANAAQKTAEAEAKTDATPKETTKEGKPAGEAKAQEPGQEFAIKVPEGVEADPALLSEFAAVAKEKGLSQEQAQAVVDFQFKVQKSQAETQEKALEEQSQKWVTQVKTDKEFGGPKLDQNLVIARKAMDQFGDPELKELLNAFGLGNHPALVRYFIKVGRALGEDSVAGATAAPSNGRTNPDEALMRSLYPTMFKES